MTGSLRTNSGRVRSGARRPLELWVLVGALLFLGFGGLYGGVAMLLDPYGALGMSGVLARLPVPDYRLPGVFLITLMGVAPLALVVALLARLPWGAAARLTAWTGHHWAWSCTVALALVLGAFLTVQAAYIGFAAPIQVVTACVGLLVLGTALAPRVRRAFRT